MLAAKDTDKSSQMLLEIKSVASKFLALIMQWEDHEERAKMVIKATELNISNGFLPMLARQIIHELADSYRDPNIFETDLAFFLYYISECKIGEYYK